MNKADKKMLDDQINTLDTVKSVLDEYRSEQQEIFDELSEKMQEGENGARIAHIIEMLEQASDSIDSIMDDINDILSGETP